MTLLTDPGVLLFCPLSSVRRVAYDEAFLIEDLLTTRITFVTGEPKAGKSLLVAGMVRALLDSEEEFLGQRVLKRVRSALYCYTDDGAEEELAERFAGTDAITQVSILAAHGKDESFWPSMVQSVIDLDPGLFVLDTVLGSLGSGEDIASSLTAQLVVERIRPIAEAGIPVLLVTHTPKGSAEGLSVASSVIGGRALAGGARGVIALRKNKQSGLTLETQINRAKQDLSIPLQVKRLNPGSEVPVWSRREKKERSPRVRSPQTLDKWRDLAQRVVRDQPATTSMRGLGAHYAEAGMSENSIRASLRPLVQHDGDAWVLRPVLQGEPSDSAA